MTSTFEDKVRPGVAKIPQQLSVTEITILFLIKQGGQIFLPYPRKRDALDENRKELTTVFYTQTSISNDENTNN